MTRCARMFGGCLMALALLTPQVAAQESAIGTFTENGRTTRFAHVCATLATDPSDPAQEQLIMLASDVPVAPADQSRGRLQTLAAAGSLHVVSICWRQGVDDLSVVPYHAQVVESGPPFAAWPR